MTMTTTAEQPTRHSHVVRMASGARVVSYSLADPEVADRVEAMKAHLLADKATSIKFLKKVGILNRSGKLHKNFGG